MSDRERLVRMLAWEVLNEHTRGNHAEAVERAATLARKNPRSTPALNLAASLHTHAATNAWEDRPPGGDEDEAASASVVRHRRAAVEDYAAAARLAPRCAMTGGMHAEALANDHRYPEAMRELDRVLSMKPSDHDDPSTHHIVYDLIDTNAKARKRDAVDKAMAFMESLAERINNEIVPGQAAKLFRADAPLRPLQLQERAQLISETFPFSSRAQLLRVYIELEQGRALEDPMHRKMILLRVVDMVADAAASFDSSLLIAFVHAKVLFALDRFDESETECRRALSIQGPIDPSLDDVPPAVSVAGADYDARVLSLRTEIRVLHNQIILVAADCWNSIQTTQHRDRVDRVTSLRVDTMHLHYHGFDKPAAKTIADAVRFHRSLNSWSFFICPNSSCSGKKFVDTDALWEHIRKQHRKDELWKKLQSVLGPLHNVTASKDDDDSLDGITLTQDSEHNDIFNLPNVQDMFESLIRSPTIGIQAEPLAEIRQRKCRQAAEILEDMKKKLSMLPKDKLSTKFEEFCSAIKNMWLKVLETSAMDHREVILPLARSFQWIEMKRSIALSAKDLRGIIGAANIDAVFGNAPGAPDHQSGDNLEPEKLKPSGADDTLKAAEICEESEVHAVNGNSGAMVDKSSSDPPTGVDESVMNIAARIAEVELDKKGISGQSVKEIASTSSYQQSEVSAQTGKAPGAPDHQSGDNVQSEKLKPSGADETLKAAETCEESSEVRVPTSNSGTMEDKSSSDPPTDVHESAMNILARIAEVELDKKEETLRSVSAQMLYYTDKLSGIKSLLVYG